MTAIDIILHCEKGGRPFTLKKRGVWLPNPGRTAAYTFDIPEKSVVAGFTIIEPKSGEFLNGGPMQAFAAAGTYTVQITGDSDFPSKRKGTHENQRNSARRFHKEVLRTRGHVLPSG